MSEIAKRANFGSKLGVILTTAGSAVGLGNVWRFPYMTGENGGAVFIFIYLLCVLLLGLPCMISEFIIGRHAQSNTARAYGKMSAGKAWMCIGCLSVLTGFLIGSYYVVVSGWCLQYVWASLAGHLHGDSAYFQAYFADFSGHPVKPLVWVGVILMLTFIVISKGVRNGIERASKMMMPLLFVLLLIVVVSSCLLPNAGKGIAFMLNPDFSKITSDVFLGALGQSFYSLSIGMGCICTYASYFSRHTNLANSAGQIALIDSMVAVLAGLMIFPAAFSVGVSPDSGPSLIFITLPNVFQQAFQSMPAVGYVVSLLFFLLLSLAALTSLISLLEVSTAFVHEEMHIGRRKATLLVVVATAVLGVFCSLSLGNRDGLMIAGESLFGWFDFVTGQLFLPVAGFLSCIFLGWFVPHKVVRDEFTNWGTQNTRFFHTYLFLVKYVCPISIVVILLHQFKLI